MTELGGGRTSRKGGGALESARVRPLRWGARSRAGAAVVTLTPAPVVDRTYVLDQLVHRKVNRASEVHEFVSGKGLNVARTMHLAHQRVLAVVPIGRPDVHLVRRSQHARVVSAVPVSGRIRININIVEGDGTTTNVNQQGAPLQRADWRRVVDVTLRRIDQLNAGWLLVSGSLPLEVETGQPIDLSELFAGARARGVRVALDTSGPELARWARSPLVDLIKPNADELATLVGRELHTVGHVVDAGRELIDGGLEYVLASLGADGAVAMSADETLWACAEPSRVVNTTGAGDAFLAGFLTGASANRAVLSSATERTAVDLGAGLALGASWGAHAVSLPTTLLDRLDDAPPAQVAEPDVAMVLAEPTLVG